MCYSKEGQLKDRREMLRVKLKSLSEEARIIRCEERRTKPGEIRDELAWHRRSMVRYEARATHLAYGIIKGVPVERIEKPKVERSADLVKKVKGMIEKYGPVLSAVRAEMLKLVG